MSAKYSLAKCQQYGRRLAARLCDQHFSSTPAPTLDGPAVLGFTPIRQLNLLIVHQLLRQWQTEIGRLRSPYFDFETPVVQAALTQFQNTLSRHICLARPAFEPLLAQAAADTLHLAIEPAAAFEQLFLSQQPESTTAQLRDGLRYLDANKEFFTAFLNSLPTDQPLSNDSLLVQLRTYQTTHYHTQQPVQNLVTAFSILLPLTEADLLEYGSASASVATSVSPMNPINQSTSPSTAKSTDSTAGPITPLAKHSADSVPQLTSSNPFVAVEPPLYEKLKAIHSPSAPLVATLRTTFHLSTPIAERRASKVGTLREAISINQRFSFINELFEGENMEYHAAIQHLDSFSDQEQARLYITENLSQRYDWSHKGEHVAKLLKLVERKYAPA